MSAIGIGTVQFGLDYGVSNVSGRVPESEVKTILDLAQARALSLLDTAAAYGDAEAVLGRCNIGQRPFRVVTKLPRLPMELSEDAIEGWARRLVSQSCEKLGRDCLDGLLMHSAQDLLGPFGGAVWRVLSKLQDEGAVRAIGSSVYGAGEIDSLLRQFEPNLIQLPINALDQRLIEGGQLRRLKERGIEVHARSLFLQGLLLMPAAQIPPRLPGAVAAVGRFQEIAAAAGLSPLQAAVAFANAVPEIDFALFGVTNAAELGQILDAANIRVPLSMFADCACRDEVLLNPALWPRA